MKQSINFSQFCDSFRDMDRNDNFSYEGKRALFNYFEEYEDDTGEAIELDVIAFCVEYSELSYDDILNQYDINEDWVNECDNEDRNGLINSWLQDNTQVIEVDSETVIIAEF